MILRTERKHDFRQPSSWRRLLAFLCAFVLLISVSGVTAFAKNDNTIYSDPVRVPIRPTEEPQPDVETEETPLLDETAELPEETPEPDAADKEPTADEIADDNQTEDIHDADETKDDTDQSPVTDEVTEEETSEEENAEQTENIIEENDSVGAETEEPEEDTEPGIIYPAGTLNAELEGCTVSINYTSEACIPENAALSINEAKGMDLYSALKAASKLIRNEEDEIWGKQVSEEGNCFYQLTITDAEGNEIRPKAWVNLICELNDAPEGVTYFLTGENARILDEQHNSVYVTDYAMEPFGYAVVNKVQIGTVIQEYSASDYVVTASYGPEASFPSNTEMKVREIQPGTPEYALYSGMTEEALGEDWSEITLERYFDITFISGSEELEPQADVDVQIVFKDVIELTEEHDIQAVHFENKEAVVIESETDSNDEEAKRSEEVIDTISFTSDSFSVFGVVQRTKITQKVLAADGNTYLINVTYNQDSGLPADAELVVTELLPGDERYDEYLQKAVRAALNESGGGEVADEDQELFASEDQYARFFDIEIRSGDQKIEPEGNVSVSITLADAPENRLDDLMVVHFIGENADILETEVNTETAIQFTTDSFSVYGVITYPTAQPQGVDDLDGRSFTVFHNDGYMTSNIVSGRPLYFEKTQNVGQAAEWVFESTGEDGQYNIYTIQNGSKKYLGIDRREDYWGNAVLKDTPQAFTVTKNSNGTYNFLTTSTNNPSAHTQYYLSDRNNNGFKGFNTDPPSGNEQMTLTFQNAPALQNGRSYMTLVKYGGKYYIVNNDASLTEVEYDPVTKKVKVDNPMLWIVEGDGSNRHVYFKTEAVGYDWSQQPTDFYRRYLNPNETGAVTEENENNVVLDNPNDPHYINGHLDSQTSMIFAGNHLYSGSNYMGVVVENGVPVRLTGNQTSENAVEILFADATEVSEVSVRNHTVDHIDISISSGSKVNVPLAYGTYYYQDPNTGEWKEYVVDTNTTLALSEKVVIDSEDMKHASIKAYDKDHKEVDNAFVITGYSSNAEYGDSSVQVRVQGSFKVSNGSNPWPWEDGNSDRVKADRLANPITYVISAVKNLDFNMVDPTRGQLYEKIGDKYEPLKVNVDVDMTASFNYFDSENECPPIQPSWGDGYNNWLWRTGGIVNGSGMDFALGGDGNEDNPNVVALEFTKMIVDEQGAYIHPAEKIVNSIGVYGNVGKNTDQQIANSVSGVNVGEYTSDTVDYSGYKLLHSKDVSVGTSGTGLVYDYAVSPGMYYIAEDKDQITDSFTDTDGNVWNYKETYITTEYVNRGDSYSGSHQLHYSDTYTKDNGSYVSIPEVVGPFTNMSNQPDRSTFLEFYVYNIYSMDDTSLDAEKQWAEDTAVPENAEVTLDLYYAKRQITDNGTQLGDIADWPTYDDYLIAEGDPIFSNKADTKLTLTADDSWQGTFNNLPKTWRDSEGNDWELDYYARETAVTVNGENCIDQYIKTIVKENAPSGKADSSDGKVTITNAIQKASVTVRKDWSDNASNYDGESITIKLIRYKKAEPVPPETGILNIVHVADGLQTSNLPDGFEVTYTYSGPTSQSGVEAGEHTVLPGEYTVTANVVPIDPDGYTYDSTTGTVTVTVSAGEISTVRFVSTFTETTPGPKNNGILKIRKEGLPTGASGFAAKYTVTGPDGSQQEILYSQFTNGEYELNNLKVGSYTVKEEVTGEVNGYRRTSEQTTTLEVGVEDDTTKTVTFIGRYNLISPDEYTTVILYVDHSNHNDYNSNVGQTVTVLKNTDVYLSCSTFDHGDYIANPQIYLYYWDTSDQHNLHWSMLGMIGEAPYAGNVHVGSYDRYCIRIHQAYNDRNMGTYSLSTNNSGSNRDRKLHTVRYRASSGLVSAGRLRTSAMPEDYSVDKIIEIELNAAENWHETIDNLDIYDQYGEPYYYGIEEASVPSGYTVSYSPASTVIATELEGITLDAINTYIPPTTGNLVVSKTITGNAADMTKAFTFTVTAKNADDQPIPDGSYGEMIFTEGVATFTLSNGERKTAENLPDGTVVSITENPDGYISVREGDQDGAIPAGVTKNISYINSLNTFGDLEISKTDTSEEIDTSKSFKFTITLEGHTGEETYSTTKVSGGENTNGTLTFANGKATITLKHQESLTIHNLPNGTRYSIKEADYTPEYFEPIVTNASGTITGGENSKITAAFINKADTVKIIADKKWPDFSGDEYTWSATFRLLADGVPTGDTITIGKDTPVTGRTFGNLPRNKRVDDEIQEIVYSMEEVSYTVYENGNPIFSFDGTNYVPSNVTGQYLPYYAVTEGENGEKICTCTNMKNTAQFFVKKEWVGVIDPSSMPTVTFSLKYYVEGQQPHSATVYEDYENIELSAPDWTWICPEELPLEINGRRVTYFAQEYAHGKQVVYDTDAYHIPPSLKHKYIIEIDGYENSYGASTNEFNQPFNAGITGNTGTITIRNKAPDYMQMDLKKKFLEYRTDENGATSLYTTTGDAETMCDTIIKIQMMRITIDERSGTDVFLTGWEEYGDAVMLGYDTNGSPYVDYGDNPFVILYQGSWAFQIINSGYTYGLPRYGFYNQGSETTPDIIPVRYRYAFKEVEVYDGDLNPKGEQWVSWLPYAWDGNGNKYMLSPLQVGQDWDRMLNGAGTSLHIEKEWTGSPAPNVDEVYIRVERREFGTNDNYEDYLSVIDNEQNLGNLAQNHFVSKNDVYTHINISENVSIPVLKLNALNGWEVDISNVQVFPNGNEGRRQYEYRIVEVGYKNTNGTVICDSERVIELFEPSYYRQGIEDSTTVEQGSGLPVTISGPNNLTVVNTSQTGSLEIIKQVPEVSTENAAEESFVFNVALNLPAGTTLNLDAISVSGGTIGEIQDNGTSVAFTVTIQGAGTATINGVPFDTTYTVTEDADSIPEGWEEVARSDNEKYSDSGKEVSNTDTQPDTVTIVNREITSVSVAKVWKVNGEETAWPEEVDSITVGLYRSANGEESPVLNVDGTPKTLTFDKTTNPEGRTFSGLPVYDEGEPVYDDDGNAVPIAYTIHELSVAPANDLSTVIEVTEEGTVTIGDYTWIVNVGEPVNGLTTITNSRMEIHILKVDIETDPKEPLPGAKFMLKRKNTEGQYVTVTGYEAIEVDENGKADIRNLEDGDYRLLETKAPAGYIPMGMPFEFTVTNGAVEPFENTEYVTYSADNQTFTIGNKAGLALPSTGGSGTLTYTIGGLMMVLLASVLFVHKERKKYQ